MALRRIRSDEETRGAAMHYPERYKKGNFFARNWSRPQTFADLPT